VDPDLPQRYSCDDLWYRFRVILLSIGANPNLKVVPYHCDSRSPKVQLQFSLPEPVNGAQARFADLRAVNDTITLEPGHLCRLTRQTASWCDSAVAPATHTRFRLSLQGSQGRLAPQVRRSCTAASGVAQASTSNCERATVGSRSRSFAR
jgi:hypothetical protein